MTERAFRTARLFKVLGNPLRYKILTALLDSPLTPSQLSHRTARRICDVSKALVLLHWAGLVCYRTVGHHVLYRVRHAEIAALLARGEALVDRCDALAGPAAGVWLQTGEARQ